MLICKIYSKDVAQIKKKSVQGIGLILKCPDYINELWYVSPVDGKKKLITFTNARIFFEKLIILIDEKELMKIPSIYEVNNKRNLTLRKKLRGKFVSLKDKKFQIWHIDNELKRREISNFDFLDLLGTYAKEISKEKLELIPK